MVALTLATVLGTMMASGVGLSMTSVTTNGTFSVFSGVASSGGPTLGQSRPLLPEGACARQGEGGEGASCRGPRLGQPTHTATDRPGPRTRSYTTAATLIVHGHVQRDAHWAAPPCPSWAGDTGAPPSSLRHSAHSTAQHAQHGTPPRPAACAVGHAPACPPPPTHPSLETGSCHCYQRSGALRRRPIGAVGSPGALPRGACAACQTPPSTWT